MSDKTELLPCPFCGSTNLVKSPWIECDNCGAMGPSPRDCDNYSGEWNRRTALAQQPAAVVPEARVTGAWESARIGDFNAGWNACRDAAFTLMKKAAYMELDTTKRSIAIQDELRAMLYTAPPAAAPELLEALEMVMRRGRIDDSEEAMNQVTAAIDKAKKDQSYE